MPSRALRVAAIAVQYLLIITEILRAPARDSSSGAMSSRSVMVRIRKVAVRPTMVRSLIAARVDCTAGKSMIGEEKALRLTA